MKRHFEGLLQQAEEKIKSANEYARNLEEELNSTKSSFGSRLHELDGLTAADIKRITCRGNNYINNVSECVPCTGKNYSGTFVYSKLVNFYFSL